MRLRLQDIEDGPLKKELYCSPSEFPVLRGMEERHEARFCDPLFFQLRVQKSGQIVEVDGQLTAEVELSCGRCLQPYEQRITGAFSLTFTPHPSAEEVLDGREGDEVELETDELGLVYYQDDFIELLHPLQDQLVMALPINALCSEDCLGLCPKCGADLNHETCDCVKKPFNNKFSALAGIKFNSSEN